MLRNFFAKKWIFGGLAFLILFSVTCVWWYHHDTATYRKTLTEAKDYLHKLEKAKQVPKVENENSDCKLCYNDCFGINVRMKRGT